MMESKFESWCRLMTYKNWSIDTPPEYICESSYYLINGVKYWRVTQVKGIINKPGLNSWRARQDYKESQKYLHARANLGTKMHKLFELKLKGNKVNHKNYSEEIEHDLDNFDNVKKNCQLKAEGLEQHLFSDKLKANNGVAGTTDYIGWYKSYQEYLPTTGRGKNKKHVDSKFDKLSFVIGDWKSSPDIYEDFWLQIAAYVFMFEEMTGVKPDGGFIAMFRDKDIKIEEKTYDELKPYLYIFKYCIKLFEFQKGILPCKDTL